MLFAHLATRFAASPENVAVEALGFVLARSQTARAALTGLAGLGGALPLPPDISFATQAGDDLDDARPDIEGVDTGYQRRCVVECKFWAGLTPNQPTAYARRLVLDEAGALVFVVPAARMTVLWTELVNRLQADGFEPGRRHFRTDEAWFTRLTETHGFVLVSWRSVLSAIGHAMEAAGEHEMQGDLRQLVGLCKRMDDEAFLPLRSEELTSAYYPRRVLQFGQLAFDVGTEMIRLGAADARTPTTKLVAAGGPGFYGRHLYAHGVTFFLAFDCANWAAHGVSPLWIRLDAQRFPAAAQELVREGPHRLGCAVIPERSQAVLVPVPLRFAVERPQLVEAAAMFAADVVALFEKDAGAGKPLAPNVPAQGTGTYAASVGGAVLDRSIISAETAP